ncbi:MAG: hypothetical protein PF693_19165 [Spirochaetia bacterium]|jgi:hypothetical protein|nr:hypothetical protein [Spirochaetia bacterium]
MKNKKKKLVEIDTNFDATFMDSILTEKEIPHVMVSYSTTPFINLFQTQKGWGHITAPAQYLLEIETLYKEFKQSDTE